MVKVGNSECGFLKLTPLSRTSAMAGAVSGVTFSARRPSGMNRMRLCGVALFWADAAPAAKVKILADSRTMVRRIGGLPLKLSGLADLVGEPCLVFLCDGFVTVRV